MPTISVTFTDYTAIFNNTAIVSDMHLGYPREITAVNTMKKRLLSLIHSHSINKICFNGDTFHDFPFYQDGINMISDIQNETNIDIICTVGNHEEKVGGLTSQDVSFNCNVVNEFVFTHNNKKVTAFHGHKTPTNPADIFVIGHIHPEVKNGAITYPCVLYKQNAYHKSDVIILPSFGQLSSQSDYTTVPTNHAPIIKDGADITTYSVAQKF